MLHFHNWLYKFWENAWFFDNYAMKINVQSKMQITFFFMASKNIKLWPRVSCGRVQVSFLFVHVIMMYE